MVIADPEEIADIDARIGFRSMKETHSLLTLEYVQFLLGVFASRLKFFKRMESLTVGEALKIVEDTYRIFGENKDFEDIRLHYKMEILKLIAENVLKKKVVYYVGYLEAEYVKAGSKILPLPITEESHFSLPYLASSLEKILKQELNKNWEKIMKMSLGKGLLRDGYLKGWPLVRETIFQLYTILLPLYPTRAHIYGRKEYQGQRAKYPQALRKDLVQLLQEKFPDDFENLTINDIASCIKNRESQKATRTLHN